MNTLNILLILILLALIGLGIQRYVATGDIIHAIQENPVNVCKTINFDVQEDFYVLMKKEICR